MKYFPQIILNIAGGAIVLILYHVYLRLVRKYHRWGFKKVFGEDAQSASHIVYGTMEHMRSYDADGKLLKYPFSKRGASGAMLVSSVVPFHEAKSANYVAEVFRRFANATPELISDEEVKEKVDISFCSVGGYTNWKTVDVLESNENTFLGFGDGNIVTKESTIQEFSMDAKYDYGLIIKIVPKLFPRRVWIAAAGLGEWGTSGAAWFLSKKWKEIKKLAGEKAFGLVIRVRLGKDESAEKVYQVVGK